MRKLIIAFSLSCVCYAQQPQADIAKTEVLPYDKSKTKVVVDVRNLATVELHNVWVKVSGNSKTYRRKVPYLNANETRQIIVEAVTEDGPWRAEIDTIEPYR